MERPDRSAESSTSSRRLVLNPTSGRGEHVADARRRADEYGFSVVETDHRGHATELAQAAVDDGVDTLAVCGGDGTLHEVVVGLDECGGLEDVTVCVVPAGTENFLAGDLGIDSMEAGFEVAVDGERRRLDLGVANDEPFVLSAVLGLPADASAAATHDLKKTYGPLAFLVAGVREGLAFDALSVSIDAHEPTGEETWSGDAIAVLVGNVRGFAKDGGQANAEDGRLDVTVVESMPAHDAITEAIEQRLLNWDTDHVRELQATSFDVAVRDGATNCSLDGEIESVEQAHFDVRPSALAVAVGDGYDPAPD
ncbi:diacylglycerol kinase family lipid kinase [Halorubellus sp. JP-L1]|uniref:diacylglycerol/lipid kinase family protein n=1 Tax=Halorubellus sp. JP-L1 TaxID=2715753 RepID=UPI00140D3167|nr:diacylglycerol kinase family protein [Halorubellus sp. JP-L1]NHN42723.1 diacylglycerol kinase family lipid kinase [Halorubellus sp. JP-L1]